MTHAGAERAAVRRDLLLLTALAAALLLPGLGARDLWNPNEPIYGVAVREMAERGDWTIPTVQGVPFAEKPILYFWAARACGLVGGVDETTLRLPSAIAAAWTVVGTYLLVLPYGGRGRARVAGLLAATTYAVFWGGRTAQMDILVTASTLGVLVPATRVLDHGAHPARGWALAGLAAGLGFLAKGPVGWIVPGLALVAWLATSGRASALLTREKALGAAVAVAVAAPWFVVLAARGETAFLHEVLVRQNLGRLADPWDHVQPWWYYLANVWLDLAPWALLAPLAVGVPGRSGGERSLDRLAWAWTLATIAFFSISPSKRSAYLFPVAPAVATLASGVVARLIAGALPRIRRDLALAALVGIAIAVGVLGVAVVAEVPIRAPEMARPAVAVGAVLAAGGAAAVAAVFSRRRAQRAVPAILIATVALAFGLAGAWALPAADARKSARPFADAMTACVGPDGEVGAYRVWVWRAAPAFYARRTFEPLDGPAALDAFSGRPGRRFVMVEREHRDEVERHLGASPVLSRAIGGNEAHLFAVGGARCLEPPAPAD